MSSSPASSTLDRDLARLSADEMVAALGMGSAPSVVRRTVSAGLTVFSVPLTRILARFDARIPTLGVAAAAAAALTDLEASVRREGPRPPLRGPALVVSNHPGAYDTMALLASVGRDDVAIVAFDRPFLRALRSFSRHLLLVPDGPSADPAARARGLRQAIRMLRDGRALVHFGAGRIEPDPAFHDGASGALLAPWHAGLGTLVRGAASRDAVVVPAIAEGVHSRRAKRSLVNRLFERRGVTTLAPLLQVSLAPYRHVEATVRFGEAIAARELVAQGGDDQRITDAVRERALALMPRA